MDKIKEDLKKMTVVELGNKIREFRHELLSLRLEEATSPVKDKTIFKKLRKNIARALTYLHQKELEK